MSDMPTARLSRDEILAILDTVMDPEVPVLSVRALGSVRDVRIDAVGAVRVVVTPPVYPPFFEMIAEPLVPWAKLLYIASAPPMQRPSMMNLVLSSKVYSTE